MRIAISVPGDTFERVSERARALGLSRSEICSRAVRRYLDELADSSVTCQINAALVLDPGVDESSSLAVAAGRRILRAGDDW